MDSDKNVQAVFEKKESTWKYIGDPDESWYKTDSKSFIGTYCCYIGEVSVTIDLPKATKIMVGDDQSEVRPTKDVTITNPSVLVSIYQNGKEIASGEVETPIDIPVSGQIEVKVVLQAHLKDGYEDNGWTTVDYYVGIHGIQYLD